MALKLCNSYPVRIWTAIMYFNPDECGGEGRDFLMVAWWPIEPGSCANVFGDDLEDVNRYWYYYAIADDGAEWAGPYVNQVQSDKPVHQCWGIGVSPGDRVAFRELDIHDNDDYTLTFVR